MKRLAAIIGLLALTGAGASPAAAGEPYARGDVMRAEHLCRSTAITGHITTDFKDRAWTYLKMPVAISSIRGTHATRVSGRDDLHSVRRTYCSAKAVMTDGRARDLYYLIEGGMGFAGMGDHLEYCVGGLDPWYVYGRYCASLR